MMDVHINRKCEKKIYKNIFKILSAAKIVFLFVCEADL